MNGRIGRCHGQTVQQGMGDEEAIERISMQRRQLAEIEDRLVVQCEITEIVSFDRFTDED